MSETVVDTSSFIEFLKARARESWDSRRTPYYLSYIAIDLKKQDVDYRRFTRPLKLVQWLSANKVPETRLVSHPTQKAKVGLIPENAEFDFLTDVDAGAGTTKIKTAAYRAQSLIKFVESLKDLPEDVAKDFNVPANVLIAILKS